MTRIAVLQMTSGIDPERNLETVLSAMREAREGGAQMVFAPEMALLLDRDRKRAASSMGGEGFSTCINALQKGSQEHSVWVSVGMPVARDDGRLANRLLVFSPDGGKPRFYDKIHMFDVSLDTGESWRESNAYAPGDKVVAISGTPVGTLGLTICYDIRFPALFEELGRHSCDVITIPAAFTVPTGKAHWHLLTRARAVEASAFVIAPAQVGKHDDGRRTFGHSLVVDPWGEVILDMGDEGPGVGFCDLDLSRIAEVRKQLPSLANRRPVPTS